MRITFHFNDKTKMVSSKEFYQHHCLTPVDPVFFNPNKEAKERERWDKWISLHGKNWNIS